MRYLLPFPLSISSRHSRSGLLRVLTLVLLIAPLARSAQADLDVVFALDTTGSMGGEIAEVQDRVRQLAVSLAESRPGETIRFGIVAFRDRGDDYVTRNLVLTSDVGVAAAFLDGLEANGGGDGPEAVVAALADAIRTMPWDLSAAVDRQIFLIGDAPPHLDYPDDPAVEDLLAEARRDRIVIHSIGCRSLPQEGVDFFRAVAYATEGSYQHIGRVRAAQAGALTRALDEVARGGSSPREHGEPIDVTWILHDDTETKSILVRRAREAAISEQETGSGCKLEVLLPEGVGLGTPPKTRLGPGGLSVILELGTGTGGRDLFDLRPCPTLATPIHVGLAGAR